MDSSVPMVQVSGPKIQNWIKRWCSGSCAAIAAVVVYGFSDLLQLALIPDEKKRVREMRKAFKVTMRNLHANLKSRSKDLAVAR